jgi:dolichol kinase
VNELARKWVHALFGIGIAVLIQVLGRDAALGVLLISLLAGLLLSDAISRGYRVPLVPRLLRDLERPGVLPGKGAILLVFSSSFCLFFFPAGVVIPAVITLGVLDGAATMVGLRFGRHRIWNGKSLEGTGAGIAVTAVVLSLLVAPLPALAITLVAGTVELLSPVDDNLVIPPVVCLFLTFVP